MSFRSICQAIQKRPFILLLYGITVNVCYFSGHTQK